MSWPDLYNNIACLYKTNLHDCKTTSEARRKIRNAVACIDSNSLLQFLNGLGDTYMRDAIIDHTVQSIEKM